VRRLQAELVKLNPARSLEQVAAENVALSAVLQEQQLGVARVQSNIPSVLVRRVGRLTECLHFQSNLFYLDRKRTRSTLGSS
jgi:hypothetical protein